MEIKRNDALARGESEGTECVAALSPILEEFQVTSYQLPQLLVFKLISISVSRNADNIGVEL